MFELGGFVKNRMSLIKLKGQIDDISVGVVFSPLFYETVEKRGTTFNVVVLTNETLTRDRMGH